MNPSGTPREAWPRAPYSVCGLVSCEGCEHFQAGRCPACVRGNAVAARAAREACAIYSCVKAQGIESCRECRREMCLVAENREDVTCGLMEHLAGERGGASLVNALWGLKAARAASPGDLSARFLRRLPEYLVALQDLQREGVEYVVSAELALRVGTSAALVRKDLSGVGHWGRRSAGYRVAALAENLRRVAGLATPRHAAWLGCERLSRYPEVLAEFRTAGCAVVAAFCYDGKHVGRQVADLVIKPIEDLPALARSLALSIAVIAVDERRAQQAADLAASAGIRSLLNLTNRRVVSPMGATVGNISPLQGLVSLLLRTPAPDEPADRHPERHKPS